MLCSFLYQEKHWSVPYLEITSYLIADMHRIYNTVPHCCGIFMMEIFSTLRFYFGVGSVAEIFYKHPSNTSTCAITKVIYGTATGWLGTKCHNHLLHRSESTNLYNLLPNATSIIQIKLFSTCNLTGTAPETYIIYQPYCAWRGPGRHHSKHIVWQLFVKARNTD